MKTLTIVYASDSSLRVSGEFDSGTSLIVDKERGKIITDSQSI